MQGRYHNIGEFSQSRHPELCTGETFYTNVEKGKDLQKLDLTNRRVGKLHMTGKEIDCHLAFQYLKRCKYGENSI